MQKTQMTEIWNDFFPVTVGLLIQYFMKEIKTVVTEKHHFVNPDESF